MQGNEYSNSSMVGTDANRGRETICLLVSQWRSFLELFLPHSIICPLVSVSPLSFSLAHSLFHSPPILVIWVWSPSEKQLRDMRSISLVLFNLFISANITELLQHARRFSRTIREPCYWSPCRTSRREILLSVTILQMRNLMYKELRNSPRKHAKWWGARIWSQAVWLQSSHARELKM